MKAFLEFVAVKFLRRRGRGIDEPEQVCHVDRTCRVPDGNDGILDGPLAADGKKRAIVTQRAAQWPDRSTISATAWMPVEMSKFEAPAATIKFVALK